MMINRDRAGQILGLTVQEVINLENNGHLHSVKVGGRYKINEEEVRKLKEGFDINNRRNPQNFILIPQSWFDEIKERLSNIENLIIQRNKAESNDEWIESGEAKKMLGVSQKTWQTYRDNRVIPFSQFGRKIYVKKADLEAFMQSHYIAAK